MAFIISLIVVGLVIGLFGLLKNRLKTDVRIRKSQLEELLEQFSPVIMRNVTISKEVSSLMKTRPYGFGRGDVFLLHKCLVIVEEENAVGIPAFIVMIIATDWKNTPAVTAEEICLMSVEFKQSLKGVNIVQLAGYDKKYTHRNFNIAVYNLAPVDFESLKAMQVWLHQSPESASFPAVEQ